MAKKSLKVKQQKVQKYKTREYSRCKICGKVNHVYEVVHEEYIFGDGCKWDSAQECDGPHCGTWCDSYYNGREARTIKILKVIIAIRVLRIILKRPPSSLVTPSALKASAALAP